MLLHFDVLMVLGHLPPLLLLQAGSTSDSWGLHEKIMVDRLVIWGLADRGLCF